MYCHSSNLISGYSPCVYITFKKKKIFWRSFKIRIVVIIKQLVCEGCKRLADANGNNNLLSKHKVGRKNSHWRLKFSICSLPLLCKFILVQEKKKYIFFNEESKYRKKKNIKYICGGNRRCVVVTIEKKLNWNLKWTRCACVTKQRIHEKDKTKINCRKRGSQLLLFCRPKKNEKKKLPRHHYWGASRGSSTWPGKNFWSL